MTPEPPTFALSVVILGGEAAAPFEQVVGAIPPCSGIAIVAVAPSSCALAARLRAVTVMPVIEVFGAIGLEPDRIYVLPPHRDVALRGRELVLGGVAAMRAPLDTLLWSAADQLGSGATAVILSGNSSDGALGIKRFKQAGGLTIAQRPGDGDGDGDEMPRAAIATGQVDLVLGAAEIATHLQTVVNDRRAIVPARGLDQLEEELRAAVAARLASEDRLHRALRVAPMVLLAVDRDHQITWGYAFGEEIADGSEVLERFVPGHAARFDAVTRAVRMTGRERRVELQLAHDGEIRTCEFRIEPAGRELTVIGLDVTASKRAEHALLEAHLRTDEFLATLSHELRNPLTPLKVALDVCKLSAHDPLRVADTLGIIERQVANLSQLVDKLLDLSRITQHDPELRRADLDAAAIIDGALEATTPLITDRGHRLTVVVPPSPLHVLGDHARLVQVVSNLISNAAKYTPEGGEIHVELAAAVDLDAVVFRVRDTGVGIAAEALPHIFEMFVQTRDARGRTLGGLGIGLHLVRRVVEHHGGTVTASSPGENRGSEFVVMLPISRRAPGSDPAAPRRGPS